MSSYVVMFPADNEAEWDSGSEADHQAVYDTDDLDDLLKCVGRLCSSEGRLEVRAYHGNGM